MKLDDVVVYSSTVKEQMERVDKVFECLLRANLKLKPEKCQLLQEEITILGHVVIKHGISPNPDNVDKLIRMKTPTNDSEVRGISG